MIRKSLLAALMVGASAFAQADPVMQESFDNIGSLGGNGWIMSNLSTPGGLTASWYQGDTSIMTSRGGTNSFLQADFSNAAADGVLNNWLISPTFSVVGGATVSFWLRAAPEPPHYTDTISVGFSDGSSAPLMFTMGNQFKASVDGWTQYTFQAPTNTTGIARFGINYNGLANTSSYIGIDSFEVSPVPEPASVAMLGAGLLVLLGVHRRRRAAGSR